MTSNYLIYAYKDPRTNPEEVFYVGKTSVGMKRPNAIKSHNNLCKEKEKEILNEGLNVIIDVLLYIDEKTENIDHILQQEEKKFIKFFKSINQAFCNKSFGQNRASHSIETRKKISEANKGKIRTEQHRKNISDSHKGITPTKETLEKMSKTRKGRKFSEEHKKALKDSWKKTHPEKCWESLSNERKNVPRSEETKKKISEANKKCAASGWETRRKNEKENSGI